MNLIGFTRSFSVTAKCRWKRKEFVPYGGLWASKWLPRHMQGRIYNSVDHQLHKVQCVVDVIDARLPMTGKNLHFSAGSRAPRVVCFTKTDLTHMTDKERDYYTRKEKDGGAAEVVWGVSHKHTSPLVQQDLINAITSAVRRWRSNDSSIEIVITGIPNTGKSTLINNLRRAHVDGNVKRAERKLICATGDSPAVTRRLSERILISHRPKIYVHDTPGVFPRTNLSKIAQLRLASANLFPIKQIPYNYLQVADYMLFSLNRRENWRPYMAYSGLSLPTDNIHVLLNAIAEKYGYHMNTRSQNILVGGPTTKKLNLGEHGVPDKYYAAEKFVARVQSGSLGKILLEDTSKMPRRYRLTQFDQIESNPAKLT